MTVYQSEETLRITAAITNAAGAAADPVSVVISIKKPDGTLDITEAAMTHAGTGSYYYDYIIASDKGVYGIAVKATGNVSRITIEPDTFNVADAI